MTGFVRIGLLMLAIFSMAALGCSKPHEESSYTVVPGSATVASRSTGKTPDETALAQSVLLTVDDFPSGWAEEPQDDSQTPFDKCEDNDNNGRTGKAETGDFSRGSGITVSEWVGIYVSENDVASALGRIDELAQCFIDVVNSGDADTSKAEFSDASFSRLSFPEKGDESRAYRLKLHVKAKGETGLGSQGDFYADVVYARVGRVGVSLEAWDIFSAPDPHEWMSFVDIAVDRARTGVH